MKDKLQFKVCGLPLKYFLPFFVIVLVCTYFNFMPTVTLGSGDGAITGVGMVGTLAYLMAVGGLCWWVGSKVPILAVIVKCTGLIDEKTSYHTVWGMNLLLRGLLPAIVAGIGINSLDIGAMVSYFSPAALLIIVLGVVGAYVGAILFGHLFGLWGYEAGVTAGLCCCDIGGSGDIAVLTACDRMSLLAFASISTRIGGALMVVWIGFLYPLLMM